MKSLGARAVAYINIDIAVQGECIVVLRAVWSDYMMLAQVTALSGATSPLTSWRSSLALDIQTSSDNILSMSRRGCR